MSMMIDLFYSSGNQHVVSTEAEHSHISSRTTMLAYLLHRRRSSNWIPGHGPSSRIWWMSVTTNRRRRRVPAGSLSRHVIIFIPRRPWWRVCTSKASDHIPTELVDNTVPHLPALSKWRGDYWTFTSPIAHKLCIIQKNLIHFIQINVSMVTNTALIINIFTSQVTVALASNLHERYQIWLQLHKMT